MASSHEDSSSHPLEAVTPVLGQDDNKAEEEGLELRSEKVYIDIPGAEEGEEQDTTSEPGPGSPSAQVIQAVEASTALASTSTDAVESEPDTTQDSPSPELEKSTLSSLSQDGESGQPDLIQISLGALKPRGRPDKRIGGPPLAVKASPSRASTPSGSVSKATKVVDTKKPAGSSTSKPDAPKKK
ncbi:hypothetical protein QCA50_018687 [Cerrena zonata]|uniref:Uncharacterized protein n=1 Tax=Cerrena zonata TaxID=2478898 RepID=A0AAW0FJJ1_9APHY